MKTIKLSHVLFSLALVAALVLAAVPMAPAYALSASTNSSPALMASQTQSPALVTSNTWVCKTVIFWRHGHRITIRRCHKVDHQPA